MLACCFLLVLPLKPIDFPQTPIAKEIDAGVRIYQLGKGMDRLYLDDRQVVGVWFDGKVKRDVDTVVWLSPSLISRWLGYLEAKEKWPDGELEHRWQAIRRDLGGKMTFVARLCSMPKIDALEGEIAGDADPTDSRDVRFLFTSSHPEKPWVIDKDKYLGFAIPPVLPKGSGMRVADGMCIDPTVSVLSDKQGHSSNEVTREDWWMRVPFGKPLQPEFARQPCFDGYLLGEFYCSTYLIRLTLPDPKLESEFEVRAFSPRKERIARFKYGLRRNPGR